MAATVAVRSMYEVSPILVEREESEAGPSNYQTHIPSIEYEIDPELLDTPPTPRKRATKSRSRSATPAGERKHKCMYEGCDKAYTKPSRLAEHELSHTGERRHACPHCTQTYLRATHLHSHLRTHLPEEDRPHACDRDGCGKRFWTPAHLRRHLDVHDQATGYKCDQCDAAFVKAHLLRDHSIITHMPPGTKPYPCSTEGCSSSFSMKHQLKAHEKTHQVNRYTCSHPSHDDQPAFDKWSLLQAHIHQAHPPVCPHQECRGRIFKNTHRLRDHLKVHDQRLEDLQNLSMMGSDSEDEGGRRKRKRRKSTLIGDEGGKSPKLQRVRSGEAGKEFACPEDECDKKFKTAYALKTHHKVVHLKIRSHACPIEGCDKLYAHLSNLNQHLKAHERAVSPIQAKVANDEEARYLTGDVMADKRYGCPAHHVVKLEVGLQDACHLRFWRVYDVRRHLKADHGLDLEDTEVRHLLGEAGGGEQGGMAE